MWKALSVAEDDPDLVCSQVQAFSRQIPLLYFILLVNTMAVAITHLGSAPELRKLTWLAGVFGAAFSSWSLLLFPFGTAFEQAQVAFYMATTLVGCVFCLMHLRTAALFLLSIAILSFSTFLVFTGYPVFIAVAIDMTLVGVALAVIIQLYYRTFADVVHAQRELQVETQR
jgi:predicted signal transduction protein with EAL and GGDEF domain